jgi:cytoskeletal protein CcmA (bactofilin family)
MFGKSNRAPVEAARVPAVKAQGPSIPSIVAAGFAVKGDVTCEGDIQLDGRIEGTVKTQTLTIGATGEVRGEIVAERIRVLGKVFGPIKAKAVELGRTARVVGDIRYETLTVESEAQVDGHIQRQDENLQVDRDSPLALVVDIAKK